MYAYMFVLGESLKGFMPKNTPFHTKNRVNS